MSETVSITVTQKQDYQFLVDFGKAMPTLVADEPSPMGKGEGPAPTQMLLAALANCLSASLIFSLTKFKQDAGGITTIATCVVDRNKKIGFAFRKSTLQFGLENKGRHLHILTTQSDNLKISALSPKACRQGFLSRSRLRIAMGNVLNNSNTTHRENFLRNRTFIAFLMKLKLATSRVIFLTHLFSRING